MNETFCKQDGNDLKELFNSQIENIRILINANDKNYNQRFDNVVQATQAALAASDRAVSKAETASEKRFDAVNEFRATLADQQRNLMPRNEVEILVKGISDRIKKIENIILLSQGKGTGISTSWGFIVGGIAIISGMIALVLNAIRIFGAGN
ncbi:MAG TPA: hypothetical protein VI461_11515 [Chitinophagaceae bacterium]|nr:hypothetical protein [Chitinophagaceae bacterium]